jgi:RND family efflux transporter MFP subunit
MTKTAEEIPKDLPKVKNRTLKIIGVCIVAAMVVFFIFGFLVRHERIEKREKMAKEIRDQKIVVLVVPPKKTQQAFDLSLPADFHAYAATALYARTNGFLATWTADINDRVKKGDVLAVISAPDTDADLKQAIANLAQQQTNYQLAANTDERNKGLIPIQGITQQQLDQFHSAREQAKAGVGSTAASVDRLKALVGFERIIAPFDGVVTSRNYDVGALISATNIGPGQELFDVAEDDQLRVFVNIPQADVLLVRFGQPAELHLQRNYPNHTFVGFVRRSAGSLDPATHTLRTEIDFANNDAAHYIYPGMYGVAVFHILRDDPVLTVPTSALLFEADGKQLAVVDKDDKVHFQRIVPGTDFGTEIEILSGLKGDERVIANPGEQLTEGLAVSPQTPEQAKEAAKKDEKKQGGGNGGQSGKADGESSGKDSKQ